MTDEQLIATLRGMGGKVDLLAADRLEQLSGISGGLNASDAELAKRYRWINDNIADFEWGSTTYCIGQSSYHTATCTSFDACVISLMEQSSNAQIQGPERSDGPAGMEG